MNPLQKKLYSAYQQTGASAVYDIANKLNLPYSYCAPCEADTPTILCSCGVCGTSKPMVNINKDIKSLVKYCVNMGLNDNMKEYARDEFIRLHNEAGDFTGLTKQSILYLYRLNLRHRFISLHTFGLQINLPE